MLKKIIYFLIINFSALAIGSSFTKDGVASFWYQNLSKAPWTPPGYLFGIAWTIIMIFFSIYMAFLWKKNYLNQHILSVFVLQWFFNVLWNPIFFYFQNAILGLIVILQLLFLVGYLLFTNYNHLKQKSIFIVPYLIWLILASSLNAYIVFYN
ncbi:MAG: TspO/MBR family protein [Flavobacterium sp.]|jgi:tryptophan-rich sensory protein